MGLKGDIFGMLAGSVLASFVGCGVPVGVVGCFNSAPRAFGDGVLNLSFRSSWACLRWCARTTASACDSCAANVAALCNYWCCARFNCSSNSYRSIASSRFELAKCCKTKTKTSYVREPCPI